MSELIKKNPLVKLVMLKGQDGEEKLINQADGSGVSFWIGTQAEYDAIPPEDLIENCIYYITDDTREDYNTRLNQLETALEQANTDIATNTSAIADNTDDINDIEGDVTTLKTSVYNYVESHNTYTDKGTPYLSALSLDVIKRSGWAIVTVGIVGNSEGAAAFNRGEQIAITGLPIPRGIVSARTDFALDSFTTPKILSAIITGNTLIIKNNIEMINMYNASGTFTLTYPYTE